MKEESTLLPFPFFLFYYLRNDNSRDKTLENISSSELRKNDNKLKSLSSSASLDPRRLHSRVSMFHIMNGHAEASEARALPWVYGIRLFAFCGKIGEWSFLLSSRLVSKLLQIFFQNFNFKSVMELLYLLYNLVKALQLSKMNLLRNFPLPARRKSRERKRRNSPWIEIYFGRPHKLHHKRKTLSRPCIWSRKIEKWILMDSRFAAESVEGLWEEGRGHAVKMSSQLIERVNLHLTQFPCFTRLLRFHWSAISRPSSWVEAGTPLKPMTCC